MNSSRLTFIIVGVVVLLLVLSSSIFRVYETKQAIIVEFGEPKRIVSEAGLKFKKPWESVIYMDRRVLNLDLPVQEVITSDQKRVIVDAFARFRIDNPLLVYQSTTDEERARDRLETIVNSVLRQVMGAAPFSAILSEDRLKILSSIRDSSNARAKSLGITMVDVRIKRADLPEANSEAIFKRMRAEREREARDARATGAELAQRIRSRADRERTVLIAESQREAEIIRGQGDGEATRIFTQAVAKDPDFFAFYRSMQAYKESMSTEDTTLVLSPNSEFFRFFDNLQGRKR